MNKLNLLIISCLLVLVAVTGCQSGSKGNESMKQKNFISTKTVEKVSSILIDSLGESAKFRVERGVKQVAALWVESDGNETEFTQFCRDNFISDTTKLRALYQRLEQNFETLNGYFHQIDVKLKEPIQLTGYESTPLDMLFGGYDVTAHLDEDLYTNKVAFITALNFPFYSLEEKTKLGET